jgi:toxin ParE1/3/4
MSAAPVPFRIEFSAAAERDFGLIFDHLVASYRGFGESPEAAFAHAETRIRAIRKTADRLATGPHRGVLHPDILPGLRHLTLDRAVYWFDVDDAARRVRVLAVFFGGQDHRRHMLRRLLE